jgi:hypothetical protein
MRPKPVTVRPTRNREGVLVGLGQEVRGSEEEEKTDIETQESSERVG